MRPSIRLKLTILLVVLMVSTIIGTILLSQSFMEVYFERIMKESLVQTYHDIYRMLDTDEDVDIRNVLSAVSSQSHDASILILDNDEVKIYSNTNEEGHMRDSMSMLANMLANQEYLDPNESQEAYEFYTILKNRDNRLNADYYDLMGEVNGRYYIIIRRSVSFVGESVEAATDVFAMIGIILTIIGSVAMMIVASRFTKPIQNMAVVAQKMQDLDFDAKVLVKGNDEITALGNAMNDLSAKLERTITELKTANIQLSEDIEKKEHIDEMRKEFLAHVSHELKTPIALIQGYAEGLKENVSDDQESRDFYCEVIMDEANKMNTMVKNLLSLNELEFGQHKLDVSRFDVVKLVNNIIQSSNILLQDFDGHLIIESTEPIYVWADEFRISEVFTNYLTNAIHYVEPQGTIRIGFALEDKQVKIWVYNSGNQIPTEELEKIWVKFYKVDKARTREYGGNGIGLSIVAATMEAHNKGYGVENQDDGVIFYFYLDTDISC